MTAWTERKTPIGKVVIVGMVSGETTIFILGGRPLAGNSYGLTPAKAREVAAALNAAADEVEPAVVQDALWP